MKRWTMRAGVAGGLVWAAAFGIWITGDAALAVTGKTLEPDPQSAVVARQLARAIPRLHLSRRELDESLSVEAFQGFLNMLDYDHAYFLASDVEEFRKEAPLLASRLEKGDVSFAFRVFERLRERVRDRVAFADSLLEKGFDLTVSETYVWKRKDAPWAAGREEWDDLWRRKVKNEYLARVVVRHLSDEGATNKAAATEGPEGTNAPAAGVRRASEADALLAPDAFVRKRHKQYLIILEDSDADFVLQRYLTAFAQAYDPHSEYMTPSTSEDFDIGMKLSLVGIGALLSSEDGAAEIEQIIPGGPADRDGRLKPGDRIIAVAQGDAEPVDILHWPLYKAVRIIRGEKGTKVVLTVIPASDISGTRTVRIDLVRDEVKLEAQAAKGEVVPVVSEGVTNRIGVIRLPAFYADMKQRVSGGEEYRSSTRDVAALILGMKTNGVEGLILDLRNNGGGSLAEAVEMTGLFISAGPVVQVRESRGIQVLSDPDPGVFYAGPLMVLVNRFSASASEILAGALQDYGRAILVGDSKTHGKGTVQSWQNLDERNPRLGSLKITTHSFYRVAGGSTQLKGVVPDIVVRSTLDVMEVGEEFLPHAMNWTVVNMARYRPVSDLSAAVNVLKSRSLARRQEDSRYRAQESMIERVRAFQVSREISLNLQDRLKLAREERDIARLEEEAISMDEEGDAGEKKDRSRDLVLIEGGRILADFIGMGQTKEKSNADRVLENAWSGK